MTNDGRKPPLDRALELFVYAPLGITLYLRDAFPMIRAMLVNRGKIAVEHRQHQVTGKITHLKSAGEVALAFGPPEIRRRVGTQLGDLKTRADTVLHRGARLANAPTPRAPVVTEPAPTRPTPAHGVNGRGNGNGHAALSTPPTSSVSAASTLPIPGYDQLSASQVVERLAGLSAEELVAVRDYEKAGRVRKTILSRIDQLVP